VRREGSERVNITRGEVEGSTPSVTELHQGRDGAMTEWIEFPEGHVIRASSEPPDRVCGFGGCQRRADTIHFLTAEGSYPDSRNPEGVLVGLACPEHDWGSYWFLFCRLNREPWETYIHLNREKWLGGDALERAGLMPASL
jgi:hypothetical protein